MSDISQRLREVFPMIESGPITTAQRALIHEAADLIDSFISGEWFFAPLFTPKVDAAALMDKAFGRGK